MSELKRLDGPDAVAIAMAALRRRPGPRAHRRPQRDHRGAPALPHHRRAGSPRGRGPVGGRRCPTPARRSTTSSTTSSATCCARRPASPSRSCGAPRPCSRSTSPRPRRSSTATTSSTRSPSTSRSAASRSSPGSSRWPATCGRSSPRSGSPRRSSGRATSWSTWPRPPAASTAAPCLPPLHGLLQAMADEAVRLFRLAMDAYADGDANLAAALDDMDDRLDQLHKDYIQAILELLRRRARRAGGGAARAGRPLLRAHRRPRREHRRAGAVHGHRAGCPSTPGAAGGRAAADARRVRVCAGGRARCWPRRSSLVFVGQQRLGPPAARTPAAGCPTTSCPAGIGPGRGHLGRRAGRRPRAPAGAARARWPRRAWPAPWR